MKKYNQSGFVLAETLVVTVFLMVIFANIYTQIFPAIGEYEKRETYDDIDSEYNTYWIKKMIESKAFVLTTSRLNQINSSNGFYKVKCRDFDPVYTDGSCNDVDKICNDNVNICKALVNILEIDNCDVNGNNCGIYLTKYQIFDNVGGPWFKNSVKNNVGNSFSSGFQDYVVSLPDYIVRSLNGANYRVFVVYHHKKDANNYYSYATLEIVK